MNYLIRLSITLLVPVFFALAWLNTCLAQPLDEQLRARSGAFQSDAPATRSFLEVLVDVTKTGAVARNTGWKLVRGQAKAHSATLDLIVQPTNAGVPVGQYYAADPRFATREDGILREANQAVLHVFVPLISTIDIVSILPVPGREYYVSAGGSFDPRPMMKQACDQVLAIDSLEGLYPECDAVSAALVVIP